MSYIHQLLSYYSTRLKASWETDRDRGEITGRAPRLDRLAADLDLDVGYLA